MEPENLNSSESNDRGFDSWLRSGAQLPDLPDGGFSHGVVERLPAPRARGTLARGWVCLGSAILGGALAMASVIRAPVAAFDFAPLDSQLQQAMHEFGAQGAGIAVAVSMLSLVYVFRFELRRWRLRIVRV